MLKEEFWNENLHISEVPKFLCPICLIGLIISDEETICEKTTVKSKLCYEITGEAECYENHFVSIATCNNPDRKEITTIAGKSNTVETGWDNGHDPDTFDETHPPHRVYGTKYTVSYTNPAIQIFAIPSVIHPDLTSLFEESFSLFWIDPTSAGNKVRIGIENSLTYREFQKHSRLKKVDENGKSCTTGLTCLKKNILKLPSSYSL